MRVFSPRIVSHRSARVTHSPSGAIAVGITRDWDKHTITISQSLYIQNMLSRFSVYMDKSNARSFDVPALDELANFNHDQCPSPDSAEYERMQPLRAVYLQIIGCLIWVTSCTLSHLCVEMLL